MSEHKYPVISGDDIVKVLVSLGYEKVKQRGSHIKMRKIYSEGKHTIIIPNHKEIDRGTLRSIVRKMSKYISEERLLELLRK